MQPDQSTEPTPLAPSPSLWQDFGLVFLAIPVLIGLIGPAPWIDRLPILTWLLAPLRLVLGFAFVLYIPGYCLQAALFPRAADLDGIERTGLSLGLSIAWAPLLALLLDRLPWGLRLWPIVWGQTGFILIVTAMALWRRARLPGATACAPRLSWRPLPWWRALAPPEQRIYTLLAAALLLAAISAAWRLLVPSPNQFMTEFYMLGSTGRAEAFPRAAPPGQDLQVTLGIANHERRDRIYRVEVWAVDPWTERRRQVAKTGPISLSVGESREWPIQWRMPWPGNDQAVAFLLFDETRQTRPSRLARIPSRSPFPQLSRGSHAASGDARPYRRLRLWLNVLPVPGPPTQVAAPGRAEAVPATPIAAPQPKPAVLPRIVHVVAGREEAVHRAPTGASHVAALAAPGQKFLVIGESEDGRWWRVCCVAGQKAWIRQGATAPFDATPAPRPAAAPPPIVYAAQNLAVYAEPDASARVQAQAPPGQRFLALGQSEDGRWLQICCVAGQKAWAPRNGVTATPPQ